MRSPASVIAEYASLFFWFGPVTSHLITPVGYPGLRSGALWELHFPQEKNVPTPIRILVVDDYEPWRRFTRSTLEKQTEMRIIGEVSDGLKAVQQAQQMQPDLILLDIGLPTINGIEAAKRIRECAPQSKILFVSENRSADVAQEALSAGAGGYVVKSDAAGELLPAVKAVLTGKRFVSASLASHFLVAATLSTTLTAQLSWLFTIISGIR